MASGCLSGIMMPWNGITLARKYHLNKYPKKCNITEKSMTSDSTEGESLAEQNVSRAIWIPQVVVIVLLIAAFNPGDQPPRTVPVVKLNS